MTWKDMTTSLKVLFVIMIIGAVMSLISVFSIQDVGYTLLGFSVFGIGSLILLFLLNIAGTIVLLIGLWDKYKWAWMFGLIYFGFFTLNALLGFIGLSGRIQQMASQLPVGAAGSEQIMFVSASIGIIIATIINIIFFMIVYKNKAYFETK